VISFKNEAVRAQSHFADGCNCASALLRPTYTIFTTKCQRTQTAPKSERSTIGD